MSDVKQDNPQETALVQLDELLANKVATFDLEDVLQKASLLTAAEYDVRRKKLASRFGFTRPTVFDQEVRKQRSPIKVSTIDVITDDKIYDALRSLLSTTSSERRALGLPMSEEAAVTLAEVMLWAYIKRYSQVFSTDSGQGYILLDEDKERPIPVRRGGHELNDFLTKLGIHSGSKARDRIGKHLGAMCWREGIRTDPRVSFHYDPENYVAYFTEQPGKLIRISDEEITRVDNGYEGQLFLFPRNYEPWYLDLEDLPATTDFCPDEDALLPKLLFSLLEFENESLNRDDIGVLLNAYITTLFLPGIVSGKILLQVLGQTGSAKTLFLRLLGRMIYGRRFEVTGMDTDEKEVENIIVNNSFVVFDDVKRTSNSAILGIIRRACTGGTCIRRELYSNFNQVVEPYRAAVALTCSEEPFISSDEMSNRSLILEAKQREDYVDEKDFIKRVDDNRNGLMAEMIVRLQSVIVAVKAQREFKPTVKNRMASFATFLLRVARHWEWEEAAHGVLEAWKEEQEGGSLDESIVAAITTWMSKPNWKTERYSPNELYIELARVSSPGAWWISKEAALIRALRRSFHAYRSRFGFKFAGRTSGHKPAVYWFEPTAEMLQAIRQCQDQDKDQDDTPF